MRCAALGLFTAIFLGPVYAGHSGWEDQILQKLDVGGIKYGRVVAIQTAVGPPVTRKDGRTGPWNRMLVVEGRNIWQIDYVGVPDDPSVMRIRKRGDVVGGSVGRVIANYVSSSEVPFWAQWVTIDGNDYLVVLTWSITRNVRTAGGVFFIYCFTPAETGLDKVIEDEGDLLFDSIDFCDISGDGVPDLEVSGTGESGVSGWLHIWQMGGARHAERIVFGGLRGFNPTVVSGKAAGRCSVVTHAEHSKEGKLKSFIYNWEPTAKAFKLSSTETHNVEGDREQ